MFKKKSFDKNMFIEKKMMYIIPLIFFIINLLIIFPLDILNLQKYYKFIDKMIVNPIIKEGSLAISGFTITIVSIFGIGISSSTIKIAKNKKSNTLYRYILSTFITAILLYLLSNFNVLKMHIIIKIVYISYIIFTFLIAFRLTVIVFLMFKDNLNSIEQELISEQIQKDYDNELKNEILTYLKLIVEYNGFNSKKEDLAQKKEILAEKDKKYNKRK